jgi:CAAX prenyl protease-like protein
VAFLGLVQLEGYLPARIAPWLLPVKVAVPGLLFLRYLLRGDYPELRGYRPGAGTLALDVLVGLAVAVLWMAPFLLVPALPRPGPAEGFDPEALGTGLVPLALGLRGLGFAGVTPFVEELFVRSWLLRYLDVFDTHRDFRDVPIGVFAWRSFAVTVFYFTFSHLPWEWGVAAITGVLYNLWLYRRRHLGAVVVAHAVTNGSILAAVLLAPRWLTDPAGQPLNLLYFL